MIYTSDIPVDDCGREIDVMKYVQKLSFLIRGIRTGSAFKYSAILTVITTEDDEEIYFYRTKRDPTRDPTSFDLDINKAFLNHDEAAAYVFKKGNVYFANKIIIGESNSKANDVGSLVGSLFVL